MLWGAALAVGAEAYRRCEDPDKAVGLAVKATQSLIESFTARTNTVDCREITGTDFNKPLQMLRYMAKNNDIAVYLNRCKTSAGVKIAGDAPEPERREQTKRTGTMVRPFGSGNSWALAVN
jgi:hypothetical protein